MDENVEQLRIELKAKIYDNMVLIENSQKMNVQLNQKLDQIGR